MLFGKLYTYYVKVHRGEGEEVWHAVWKVIYHYVKVHRGKGEGEAMWRAVWKVIYLLCESKQK